MRFLIVVIFFLPILCKGTEGSSNLFSKGNNGVLIYKKQMAIDLAEIYVAYAYGKKISDGEKPYIVKELEGYWYVEGFTKPNVAGGVFSIKIKKVNGEVVSFHHGE
ncbi:NTF2 fold immunity protein [Scandinavium sp. NPDC088450]|uniref:NTF2 fold immunity protein n=1 Tax=Scandinavium sp. NPDC088450 TaxID=3364514 RepID=UPI00384DAAE5